MKNYLFPAFLAVAAVLNAAPFTASAGLLDSVTSAVDSTKSATNTATNVTNTAKDPKGTMKRKVGIQGNSDDPTKNSLSDNAKSVENIRKAAKDPVNTLNPLTSGH